ncbi:hypothetical protein EOPP23_09665 [Endozoicomonas sp. OPT23]|uniref:S8 family peptidase n=1 Tax=Endozoicomonas sp. OPT23 TaxID=2072845 RepID=UPI00129A39F5|nr:S8 family peptidase [Endozoicomonas sp. OPT23]MRI33248.1 hypothetical protein [Endozoicomonas sp. OPT23]
MWSFSSRSEELVGRLKSGTACLAASVFIGSASFSAQVFSKQASDVVIQPGGLSKETVPEGEVEGPKEPESPQAEAPSTGVSTGTASSIIAGNSKWYVLLGVAGAAAAGGGGGGSNGSSDNGTNNLLGNPNPTPLSPQDPQYFNTTEYRTRYDLNMINAKEAYANISSLPVGARQAGDGVTIAILDTGVDTDHINLNESIDLPNCGTQTCDNNYGEEDSGSHGTHVAGIAAADRDSTGMHGVAYNADILSGCANISGGCGTASTASLLKWSADQNARVANMSYAYTYSYGSNQKRVVVRSDWSQSAVRNVSFGEPGSSRYQGVQSALERGLVGVVAAGNHNVGGSYPTKTANVGVLAAAPLDYSGTSIAEDLNLQWIAVVNVTSNKQLSSRSHGCGEAALFCLAAPGTGIYSTIPNDGHGYKSGTSMAAPQVSGAVALVAAAFPTLQLPSSHSSSYLCDSSDARANNAQCHSKAVVNRIFVTAEDLGESGTDSVYGQGLLDLEAATEVIGIAQLRSSNGQQVNLGNSALTASKAMGDSLNDQLADVQFIATDSYDKAGFVYSGTALLDAQSVRSNKTEDYLVASRQQKLTKVELTDQLTYSFSQSASVDDTSSPATVFSYSFSDEQSVTFSRGLNAANQFGLLADDSLSIQSLTSTEAFANPFQSFNSAATGVSHAMKLNDDWQLKTGAFQSVREKSNGRSGSMSVEFTGSLSKNLELSVMAGYLKESKSLLEARGAGLWNFERGSSTQFYGINLSYQLQGSTYLLAGYNQGNTEARGLSDSSFTHQQGGLISDSLSFGMKTSLDIDTSFAAFVTQPMAIRQGSLSLNLPTGYQGNQLSYETVDLDLSPASRQTDFELVIRREFRQHNAFGKLNLLRIHNSGNIRGANDTAAILNFGIRF